MGKMDGDAASGFQVTKNPSSPGTAQGVHSPFPPFSFVGADLRVSLVKRIVLYRSEIFFLWLALAAENIPFLRIWVGLILLR